MKTKKYTFEKSNIALNWSQLTELKFALAKSIKDSIQLEKSLGLKPSYFNSTKHLIDIYKLIVKKINQY